jgi:biopolymer transport protein TolR
LAFFCGYAEPSFPQSGGIRAAVMYAAWLLGRDGMAASIQHTSSRGRGRMRRRAMAEINVTPFVDVMLVLLIVFMVTAPLLTVGVPVDLPKTKAPALGQDREPLSITVRRDGVIFLQKEQVPETALVDKLKAIAANGYDQRIFVRGDDNVNYGRIVRAMSILSAAGFNKIGLPTDPECRNKGTC